jgi:hypothetical protein
LSIFKIATEKSILREYRVWSAVLANNNQHLQNHDAYLVPLRKIDFDSSAAIEIGESSTRHLLFGVVFS